MFKNRGYSFVEWAVIFAIVSAGVIFYLSPAKRGIVSKTLKLTDHCLWGAWGSSVQQDGGRNYNQTGPAVTVTTSSQSGQVYESEGKVQSRVDSTSDMTSSYSSY